MKPMEIFSVVVVSNNSIWKMLVMVLVVMTGDNGDCLG